MRSGDAKVVVLERKGVLEHVVEGHHWQDYGEAVEWKRMMDMSRLTYVRMLMELGEVRLADSH
jgi:hypothetical protein